MYYNENLWRNPVLKKAIKEIMDETAGHDHDGTNSKAVSVGTVTDGTVTNAKLATDVKVGSVAALTTTTKASAVLAINELVTTIGALASLSTTTKASIVLAINEILTNTGNVAALSTTAKTLVGAINELDSDNSGFATKTGVETLTNKTLTAPTLSTPKIADGDTGLTITSADQTNAAAVLTIPDIGDAADEVVCKDTTQTLTLKTLTSPVLTTPDVVNGVATHDYGAAAVDWTLSASELKAKYLVVTNANGAANIIAPSTSGKEYVLVNNSGQAITLKKTAGTGIAVANTKVATLAYIGSDYIRITADV